MEYITAFVGGLALLYLVCSVALLGAVLWHDRKGPKKYFSWDFVQGLLFVLGLGPLVVIYAGLKEVL